ncbi:MAG: hypothetical protein KDA60_02025 [Planctomycetales bacterium]|nr:hypothetical protein [Planctomycetales bacterium]
MVDSLERQTLPRQTQIDLLLEEYRALNSLLLFRLNAMDRRLPATSAVLASGIAAAGAIPPDSRLVLLATAPLATLWLLNTTVQHAKAKEDNLRRIDEIERHINRLAGEPLLVFQSQHPNRQSVAGGRTGFLTVAAASYSSLVMVALCVYLYASDPTPLPRWPFYAYAGVIFVLILLKPLGLRRYRYLRANVDSSTEIVPRDSSDKSHS